MDDPLPLLPIPPSPSPSPAVSATHASKGKAREGPAIAPEIPQAAPPVAQHPYALRGKRRRDSPDSPTGPAVGSPGSPIEEGEDVTPRKGDVLAGAEIPQVQVNSPSPSRPTRRARTDGSGAPATGEVSVLITVHSITHTYIASRICVARAGWPISQSAGHRPHPGVPRPPAFFVIKRRSLVILLQNGPCPSSKQSLRSVCPHSFFLFIC